MSNFFAFKQPGGVYCCGFKPTYGCGAHILREVHAIEDDNGCKYYFPFVLNFCFYFAPFKWNKKEQ